LPGFADLFGTAGSDCDVIGIGAPIDGYPNWQERTLLVFTNMVRMAPVEYRDTYMTAYTMPPDGILNAGFPAVPPLYSAHALNQAARYHAEDLSFNCNRLQHNSCDGTLWYQRIRSFYPQATAIGENIAYTGFAGATTPPYVVNMFLCDFTGTACAGDDQTGYNGHRRNIMAAGFTEMGSGFAAEGDAYWVQDFNGVQLPPQPPVAAVSHVLTDAGTITFYLNYYDRSGQAPLEVIVVIDGQSHALDLGLGVADAGTYQVTLPRADGCRSYYFLVTEGSETRYRYPGNGAFNTYGEGGCMLDYTTNW
jgi:hypothetical protein